MACVLHPLNTQAEAEAQVSPCPSPEFLDPGLDSCTALATASPRRGPRRGHPLTPSLFLPEEKEMHDAPRTLGIFQHNCLKIAWPLQPDSFLGRVSAAQPVPAASAGSAGLAKRAWGEGHGLGPRGPFPCSGQAHLLLPPHESPERVLEQVADLSSSPPIVPTTPWAGPTTPVHLSSLLQCLPGFSVPRFPHLRKRVLH